MRHNKKKFTLGRESAPRKALMRNLATSLVIHGSVKTTAAKAKALRTVIEPIITRARRGNMLDRALIAKALFTKIAVKKMMQEIGPMYKDRNGGYTRITKLGIRSNDAAEMAVIEFV